MPITLYPDDGAVLQRGQLTDVVAIITAGAGETAPSRIAWTVQGEDVVIDPALSPVTLPNGVPTATTRVMADTLGTLTLTATAQDGTMAPTVVTYRIANLQLANRQILAKRFAEATPVGGPIEPANDARTLPLHVQVVDEEGQGIAQHPVYLSFQPDVVDLYEAEAPYCKVALPRDPDYKGYIAETDGNGVVALRLQARHPTIGLFTCVAAGKSTAQLHYAFIDKQITMPSLPVPEGVTDPLAIPPDSPAFQVGLSATIPPQDQMALIWLRGKDGVYTFGRIASLAELQRDGDTFSYDLLDNSGKRVNRLAYQLQRGLNPFESYALDFAATGDPYVGPDPHVVRTLPVPSLNLDARRLLNMDALAKGVVLTIPPFSAGQITREESGFELRIVLYLNAWDPVTRQPRRRRVAMAPISLAAAPDEALTVPLLETDLRDYAFEPAPGAGVGRLMADYAVLALASGALHYSKVLGQRPDPDVLIETTFKRRLSDA